MKEFHRCSKTVVISAVSASGQSKLDTAAGTLASGRQTLAANRQQLAQDLAELAPYEDDTERLEQGIAVLMQDEALRTLCLCAAVALLALAFVAAGLTLRQCVERAQ